MPRLDRSLVEHLFPTKPGFKPYKQTLRKITEAIQPSNDPLEVLIGLVTRLRAKKFKEAFNGLLQETWAKVDLNRICNNKEQALINLIHV
jgi:hypothetical protein